MTTKVKNLVFYVTSTVLDASLVSFVHIDEVCSNLVSLNNDVVVYAPKIRTLINKSNYQIKYLTTPHILQIVFYQAHLMFRLIIDSLKEKPSVIYVRYNELLFIPVLVGKLLRKKVILEINGVPLEELKQLKTNNITRLLLKFKLLDIVEKFNIKMADKIITVTNGIQSYYISKYELKKNKITVIANGVNTEEMIPTPIILARSAIGIDTNAMVVGYVGSFLPWQGLLYILESASIVIPQHPNTKYLLIGSGPELLKMQSYIQKHGLQENVEIRTSVPHCQIPRYINAMDICISYPDKFRSGVTSPFKLYEYLSCKKAVISSDIKGIREEFGDTIIYAEAESPESLAAKITGLILNKEQRDRLGNKGRALILKNHRWKDVTKKILTFIYGL